MDSPERQEGPQHPWQGWRGRQRVRQTVSLATPIAKLLISTWSPSEICLRNVPNSTGWWEWKMLINPGEKKGSLLQVADQSGTDHNKGARSIAGAVAQPPWKLQGMQNQPWKWLKEQFALSMVIVESWQQGERARQKQCSCPSSCRCQTSWSLMDVEIGQERIRGQRLIFWNMNETKAAGWVFFW